jgi:hypothetical protein
MDQSLHKSSIKGLYLNLALSQALQATCCPEIAPYQLQFLNNRMDISSRRANLATDMVDDDLSSAEEGPLLLLWTPTGTVHILQALD